MSAKKSVIALTLIALLGFGQWSIQAQSTVDHSYRETYVSPEITFALVGDAIITRKISPYKEPQFLSMIDIIRDADLSFVNLEMLFFNYEDAYPAANSGGTWMRGAPELIEELKWAGFDVGSAANNHSLDYSISGMLASMKNLKKAAFPFAGIGKNLAEANAPVYVETDAGRVALISVSSTFSDGDQAGPQRKDMHGRPGLNPLLFDTHYKVSKQDINALKQFAKGAELNLKEFDGNKVEFLGKRFVIGEKKGIEQTVNKKNLARITASIRDAKRNADWVIINSHTHEGNKEVPPKFLEEFAHSVIDAGADIVVAEGYHANRPIEIYKDRPIFYSLGDFIFQNETVEKLPADIYDKFNIPQDSLPGYLQDYRAENWSANFVHTKNVWQSVIAVPTFFNKTDKTQAKLKEIVLYPISLGYGRPRAHRGRPRLADQKEGEEIILRLKQMSASYGTKIIYDKANNIGRIMLK